LSEAANISSNLPSSGTLPVFSVKEIPTEISEVVSLFDSHPINARVMRAKKVN
jgi:hypothetical protein